MRKLITRLCAFTERRGVSVLLCFISGLLYAVPYFSESCFALTYISLFAFFALLQSGGRLNKPFRHIFAFTFGFYLLLYSFLSSLYPFSSFGFTTAQAVFTVIAACLCIPLFHALLHSLVLLPIKLFKNKPLLASLALPLLWVCAEFVTASGTLAFPWGTVSLSQTGFLPVIQTSSLFGGEFITLVIVLFCSLCAYSLVSYKRAFALIGASVFALNLIAGTALYLVPSASTSTVKVAALQGDVRMEEKWEDGNLQNIKDTYVSLIHEAAADGATLIILPESAIPENYYVNGRLDTLLKNTASDCNATLIVGILEKAENASYNSVVAVLPDGSFSGRYDKRHPVPFGEYIPYREFFETVLPFIKDMNLSNMTLIGGEKAEVLETEDAVVGTLVCFDSIFPSLALDEAREGANLMTVVTNDSWFGASSGVYQHSRHAVLRAVETNRYVIQAANTGISSIVDEKGNVLKQTEPLTKCLITGEAKTIEAPSLYTLTGDLVTPLSFALLLAGIIYVIICKLKHTEKTDNGNQNNQTL